MELSQIVSAFAEGIKEADAAMPIAVNQRSGKPFRPGIGPHTESDTIQLAFGAFAQGRLPQADFEVPYPASPNQKCDIFFDGDPGWAIEVKMLRMYGDNGKPNDNMLLHLLSPYPKHRSAVTDCPKLRDSGFPHRLAIVIYGYESEQFPLSPAITAFETLAREHNTLSTRCEAHFDALVHPVHRSGSVYGWELPHSETLGYVGAGKNQVNPGLPGKEAVANQVDVDK